MRASARSFVLLTASIAAGVFGAQTTPTFSDVTVHDPSVVRDGSTYYVFGSHLASASSPDLEHWTQITSDWNAATNPTCSLILNSSPQTQFAAALAYTVPPAFWAPDVRQLGDGRYYFYYCVCNNTSRAALGLAVANAITGPYTNVTIMLESGMSGLSPDGTVYNNAVHPNVVDPSVFYDHAGKLWMVYGSYSGGIFILSLDPTTGQPFPGQAYGKRLTGGNNCRIEGSFITYSPETGCYYLFFTYGGFDIAGGYNIRCGRSVSPDGPYLDAAGNDLTTVKGAPGTVFDDASIAPYAVKLMGNYQFLHVASEPLTTSTGYISPGGTSVTYDATTGKYLMVFHTRFVGLGETHHVRVHQMFFNADGWPVVAPQRYAQETITATDPTRIPGDYKLINHGKDISATVKTSAIVTLNADRSVTGTASGTWQLSGDHYASLTLAGTTYHGVFVRLWDDDNQVWAETFTAVSTGGVTIWGTKVVVPAAPTVTTQPVAVTAMSGTPATFATAAGGYPDPVFQWQASADAGTTWTNLSDGTAYAGTATTTVSIPAVSAALGGDQYRCVVTNSLGTATSLAATLTVTPAPQAITFAGPGDQPFSIAPIPLSATADSGLPVSFAIVAGPATVAGNTVTLTGSGQVTVEATQAGDADHAAAAAVDRTFTVTPNFAAWQQSVFTPAELLDPARSGPTAVCNPDGLPNLVKYALGLNPKVNASGSAWPAPGATATNWLYTYPRPTSVTDVTCGVEVSTDLVNWTTEGVTQTLVSSANGIDTWQGAFPRGTAPAVFFRLRVSQ